MRGRFQSCCTGAQQLQLRGHHPASGLSPAASSCTGLPCGRSPSWGPIPSAMPFPPTEDFQWKSRCHTLTSSGLTSKDDVIPRPAGVQGQSRGTAGVSAHRRRGVLRTAQPSWKQRPQHGWGSAGTLAEHRRQASRSCPSPKTSRPRN